MFTVRLVPVWPPVQVTVPLHPVAVRSAVSSPHRLVLSDANVGGAGLPPIVIITAFDAPLVPQVVVHVAV